MDQLIHYGTPRKSGRYKWGSGERPYQSMEGRELSRREKKAARVAQREREQKIEEQRREIERERKFNAQKERAFQKGDVRTYAKNADKLTTKEIEDFIKRVEQMEKLNKKVVDLDNAGYFRIKRTMDKIGDLGELSKKYAKYFESAADIKRSLDTIMGNNPSTDQKQSNKKKKD